MHDRHCDTVWLTTRAFHVIFCVSSFCVRWTAYYGPLWTMIAIATMACISIFLHVRQYSVAAHIKQQTIVMPAPATTTTTTTTARIKSTHEDDSSSSRPRPEIPGDLDPVDEEAESSAVGQIVVDDEEDSDASDLYNLDSLDPYNEDEEEEDMGEEPCEYDHWSASVAAGVSEQSGRPFERRMVVPQTFCKNLQHSRYVYRQSRRLREIAHQCFWYAAAFYINFAALTATRVIQLVDKDKVYYPLVLAAAICVPVQGTYEWKVSFVYQRFVLKFAFTHADLFVTTKDCPIS